MEKKMLVNCRVPGTWRVAPNVYVSVIVNRWWVDQTPESDDLHLLA